MNAIQLKGGITRGPRLAVTKNGKAVANLQIAVPRKFDRDTRDFFHVIAWQELAERATEALDGCTGLEIVVTGRIQQRRLPPRQAGGEATWVHEVIADEIEWPPEWVRGAHRARRAGGGTAR